MRDTDVKTKRKTKARWDLIHQVSLAIRASQNTSEAFDEVVADALGINRTDLRCLDILQQRGPLSAGELAEAMHLTSGAITTLVDRLERAGYARRVRDTSDRRRVLVELAPETEARTMKFYEPLFTGSVRIFDDYSDNDLRVMLDFLVRGREMVEQELGKLEKERLAAEGQASDPA